MHPTPPEQLHAAIRTIERVASDPSLAAAQREALDDTRRMLERLERSWTQRLPFLLLDNKLAIELLAAIAALVPSLRGEIEAIATEREARAFHAIDEDITHELNKRLQHLLGRAVHLLPDDADGRAARARIAAHARSRLAADPTLHRTTTDRLRPQDAPS